MMQSMMLFARSNNAPQGRRRNAVPLDPFSEYSRNQEFGGIGA